MHEFKFIEGGVPSFLAQGSDSHGAHSLRYLGNRLKSAEFSKDCWLH